MTPRKAIIVSPHFPPSTLAGVHRARLMAKGLPAHGWRPIVLSVAPEHYTERGDPALAALVAPDLAQLRVGAWSATLCRRFGVGDIGLRAFASLSAGLDAMIRRERPDVVFITGSPFYPLFLARQVRHRHGVPVILDFQDPWVSRFGATRPPWSKNGLSHRLATLLEPIAVKAADAVTSVSEVQNQEMLERWPWLRAERMSAIPIGGDPDDFTALRTNPLAARQVAFPAGTISFSYVGTFLPRARPLVETLFSALADLRRADPALAARLRFNFVGVSNQPDAQGSGPITPLAIAAGVEESVFEVPHRVPYLEALDILANSDALLLIGSDEPHYTASKIFPGLMSGRPFLSLFHAASSAHAILSSAGAGIALSFDSPETLADLRAEIALGLRRLALEPQSLGARDPASFSAYTADAVGAAYAGVFDRAIDAARARGWKGWTVS